MKNIIYNSIQHVFSKVLWSGFTDCKYLYSDFARQPGLLILRHRNRHMVGEKPIALFNLKNTYRWLSIFILGMNMPKAL